jgi:hypothetical protein
MASMAGPAFAHTADLPHVHGDESLSLLLGLGLIAVAVGAAVLVKGRAR